MWPGLPPERSDAPPCHIGAIKPTLFSPPPENNSRHFKLFHTLFVRVRSILCLRYLLLHWRSDVTLWMLALTHSWVANAPSFVFTVRRYARQMGPKDKSIQFSPYSENNLLVLFYVTFYEMFSWIHIKKQRLYNTIFCDILAVCPSALFRIIVIIRLPLRAQTGERSTCHYSGLARLDRGSKRARKRERQSVHLWN